jgi:hypothetical protein
MQVSTLGGAEAGGAGGALGSEIGVSSPMPQFFLFACRAFSLARGLPVILDPGERATGGGAGGAAGGSGAADLGAGGGGAFGAGGAAAFGAGGGGAGALPPKRPPKLGKPPRGAAGAAGACQHAREVRMNAHKNECSHG